MVKPSAGKVFAYMLTLKLALNLAVEIGVGQKMELDAP
jgi:hypothetical protein